MKKFYELDEDYEPTDPGNVLRGYLSNTLLPYVNEKNLMELLYTAQERGIIEDLGLDIQTVLAIHRLFVLSEELSDDEVKKCRM